MTTTTCCTEGRDKKTAENRAYGQLCEFFSRMTLQKMEEESVHVVMTMSKEKISWPFYTLPIRQEFDNIVKWCRDYGHHQRVYRGFQPRVEYIAQEEDEGGQYHDDYESLMRAYHPLIPPLPLSSEELKIANVLNLGSYLASNGKRQKTAELPSRGGGISCNCM